MVDEEQIIQLRGDEHEATFGPLRDLLKQAGAIVSTDLMAAWTPEQCDEASEWARAQIAATAKDKPGHHTSVRWPDHVAEGRAAGGLRPGYADEPIDDGEVFLGDGPEGVHGTGTVEETITDAEPASNALPVAEALAQAAELLDADRAGEAAKPLYQPPIPGIHPPFDWRSAQLRTEALETSAASAESAWDDAKQEASDRKKDYDSAIEALRKHIQETHIARVEAEYQHRGDSPIAPVPGHAAERPGACITEITTGKPCPICRNITVAPDDNGTTPHLAAAILALALEETLGAETMAEAIEEITRVIIPVEDLKAWTPADYKVVARYLKDVAGENHEGIASRPVPLILGRPHEVGEIAGGCRVCGALLQQLAELEGYNNGFPIGTRVGTDCAGEPVNAAEPTRVTKPRHAKTTDRQKAKQASGATDHAAEQKADGKKRTAKAKKGKK